MVNSQEIIFEKIETQELSLEIHTLSDIFNQNVSVTDNSSEPPQTEAVDANIKSKPQIKKCC